MSIKSFFLYPSERTESTGPLVVAFSVVWGEPDLHHVLHSAKQQGDNELYPFLEGPKWRGAGGGVRGMMVEERTKGHSPVPNLRNPEAKSFKNKGLELQRQVIKARVYK